MSDSDQDTYLWLEDVASSESLDWARKRNLESEQSLVEDPAFSPLKDRLLSALDSDKRLAIGTLYGSHAVSYTHLRAHRDLSTSRMPSSA